MTNLDSDFVTCRCCGKKINKKFIGSVYIREDNTFSKCKVCSWLQRNQVTVNSIKNYDNDSIQHMLEFFYNMGGIYLNDFANQENISLNDTINLFQSLHIANAKCLVKSNCEYCRKETKYPPNAYLLTENHYCCNECYWNDKTNKMKHGEESQFYNRIETFCTNCNKKMAVIPYTYKKKNSFGDNHNFCCYECYWSYRRKYYVKEKSVNWQREFTEEQHQKMAMTAILNARKTKARDTKIQLAINNILDIHNIKYIREYLIGFMQIDNYLNDYNLMIEVHGDYWHANPLKYNKDNRLLNDTQTKDIIQDKKKHTMIKNKGIEILYLWEKDILENIDLCEALILKYINSNGILENYNSFNWELKNNVLILKDQIIYSYQELPYEECKKNYKKRK